MGAGCTSGHSSVSSIEKSVVDSLVENIPSFKILLVGDSGVGKSSVFKRYMRNQYESTYTPNKQVGIHNVVRKINVPENAVVAVTMWDLPGREDMDLRKSYYKNTDAAIVVVDITDNESIEMAGTWKHEICNNVTVKKVTTVVDKNGINSTKVEYVKAQLGSIPVILFGNKYDLIEPMKTSNNEMIEKLNSTTVQEIETNELNENIALDEKKKLFEMAEEDEFVNQDKNLESESKTKTEEEETDVLSLEQIPDTYRKEGKVPDEFFIDNPIKKSKLDETNNNKLKENENIKAEKKHIADKMEMINESLPSCVHLLQETEKMYGFISSFHCSAKSSEGNVDVAVQALIRHLLQKRGRWTKTYQKIDGTKDVESIPVKEKNDVSKSKALPQQQKKSSDLDNVGIPELDELFAQCQVPIEMAVKFKKNFKRSLKYFKQECVKSGVVDNEQCSLEDCIFSLRTMLGDEKILVANEDKGFVNLEVHGLKEDVDANIQKVLSHFNTKFASVCEIILRDSPTVSCFLDRMHNQIKVRGEEIIENNTNTPSTDNETEQKLNIPALIRKIDGNRAKLLHTQELIQLNVEQVEKTGKKVQTSLMW